MEPSQNSPERTVYRVHFEDRSGIEFERLVFAFLVNQRNWTNISWLGETGSDQGRDIWGEYSNQSYCYQCANYRTLTLRKIKEDIAKLIKNKLLPDNLFIVCGGTVSANVRMKGVQYAIQNGIKNVQISNGVELEESLRVNSPVLLERFVKGHPFPELSNAQSNLESNLHSNRVIDDPFDSFDGKSQKIDFGSKPEKFSFYGRDEEVEILNNRIKDDAINVVFFTGLKGTGKTSLVSKMCDSLLSEFDFIFWRELVNLLSFNDFLLGLQKLISKQSDISLEESVDANIEKICLLLKQRKVLIIVDNYETILSNDGPGGYRDGYQYYQRFFEAFSVKYTQSKIIVTSRELPPNINRVISKSFIEVPVRGLNRDACARIFQDVCGIKSDKKSLEKVVKYYNGNPFIIDQLAKFIDQVFNKSVKKFLEAGFLTKFKDAVDVVRFHFDRCTDAEKSVLYWLCINRIPTSIEIIREDLLNEILRDEVPDILGSIKRKLHLINSENGFSLQPIILEFITDEINNQATCLLTHFIEEPSKVDETANILLSHSLQKMSSKEFVQQAQQRVFILPIIERLQARYGDRDTVIRKLFSLLKIGQLFMRPGYLLGNVINVSATLSSKFENLNFSNTYLWQVDLSRIFFLNVNFSGSHFRNYKLTETFGNIFSIVISNRSNEIYTSDDSCKIIIWDKATLRKKDLIAGHTDWIRALALNEDENYLLSGADDNVIKEWDINNRKLLYEYVGHNGWIWDLKFKPGERTIFASSSEDGSIIIWDTKSKQQISSFDSEGKSVRKIAFLRNKPILICGNDNGEVIIWNYQQNVIIHRSILHRGPIKALDVSGDDALLITGGVDKNICLFDVEQQKLIYVFDDHEGQIRDLKFSPRYKHVFVSACDDKLIKVWNCESKKSIRTLTGHQDWIKSVAFINNGEDLLSSSHSQEFKFWNIRDSVCYNTLKGYSNPCVRMEYFVIEKKEMVVCSYYDGKVVLFEKGKKTVKSINCSSKPVTSLFFDTDEQLVYCGDELGMLYEVNFSPPNLTVKKIFNSRNNRIRGIAKDLATKNIFISGPENTINLVQKGIEKTIVKCGYEVWTMKIHKKKNLLFFAGENKKIGVLDLDGYNIINELEGHSLWIWSLKIIDDSTMVSVGGDGKVIFWDIDKFQIIKEYEVKSQLWDVDYSARRKLLLVACSDKTVKCLDANTGVLMQEFCGHNNQVMTVRFGINDNEFITSSDDGRILIWDLDKKSPKEELAPIKPYNKSSFKNCIGLSPIEFENIQLLGGKV